MKNKFGLSIIFVVVVLAMVGCQGVGHYSAAASVDNETNYTPASHEGYGVDSNDYDDFDDNEEYSTDSEAYEYIDSTAYTDAILFKIEHETLNNMPSTHNEEFIFQEMYIPEINPFVLAEWDEINDLIENGTGVVFLSFPNCPWCRSFIPVLIDAAVDFGVTEILYRNILDCRNILTLEDGVLTESREGQPGYYRLLELLDQHAPVYDGLEDDTIRRVFVPALIFVEDGEVIHYQGALQSFRDRVQDTDLGGWQWMNDDEADELTSILVTYFSRVFGSDSDCPEAGGGC